MSDSFPTGRDRDTVNIEAKGRGIVVSGDVPPEPTSPQYTSVRTVHWQKMLDDGEAVSVPDLAYDYLL